MVNVCIVYTSPQAPATEPQIKNKLKKKKEPQRPLLDDPGQCGAQGGISSSLKTRGDGNG